jgi:mediator of RNA polymerase II transcription subunit 31
LENEEFLNYLEYLGYWCKPENVKYLIYPNCLHVLSLLKEPRFRQEISRADVAKLFMDDFYMKWLGQAAPQAALQTDSQAAAEPSDVAPTNGANGVKQEER